jgi:hypothetical protein
MAVVRRETRELWFACTVHILRERRLLVRADVDSKITARERQPTDMHRNWRSAGLQNFTQ